MAERRAYPTGLSDAGWAVLGPLVPAPKGGGRPAEHRRREICNGIRYALRSGCAWRLLPHDLPPWQAVYGHFWAWRRDGTWDRIHEHLRGAVREHAGRDPQPSAGIVDSQRVKMTEQGGERGYGAGKKVAGRRRHLLLVVAVRAAQIQDRAGAKMVCLRAKRRCGRLQLIWADGGYQGKPVRWTGRTCGWVPRIGKRTDDRRGFVVPPKRWIAERTFGWLDKRRRLSKDYERLPQTSEALIQVATITPMVRRLARPPHTAHRDAQALLRPPSPPTIKVA